MTDAPDLLLLSNSAMFGRGYLEHAFPAISELLGETRRVHFVGYALADLDAYTARIQAALSPLDVTVVGIHRHQIHARQLTRQQWCSSGAAIRSVCWRGCRNSRCWSW